MGDEITVWVVKPIDCLSDILFMNLRIALYSLNISNRTLSSSGTAWPVVRVEC